jgi:dihydroorotase
MNILIRQARIISPGSGFHNKVNDILIEGGLIAAIRKNIQAKGNVKVIEGEQLYVSAGWVDMQAAASDPGFEHKEDLNTLLNCAAAGGFTTVCVHSNTQPPLHSKAQIEYVIAKTQNKVVNVLPFGNITVDGKGKEIAEMYDMKLSGAAGFSDHKQPLSSSGTLVRALQYSTNIGSFLVTHCDEESLSKGGQAHEGESAVALGLKGIPALAEEIMLQRNLSVLEYAGGRLHIPTVSTRGSVELVRRAKSSGLQVTCGVAAVNLLLDESSLEEFDTNYKLNPPLRSRRDVQALRNALTNGVIDVIVSDHNPQDPEGKELEFDLAEPGIINLQTAFSCALEGLKPAAMQAIVRSFSENPRRILGLPEYKIGEEIRAELTIFSPAGETVLKEKNNRSRSRNSPFMNQPLQGRVIGIINGGKSFFN